MNSDREYKKRAKVVGPMPPFPDIAVVLWGSDADYDSDGDATAPESTTWQELTLQLRPLYQARIDIDPCDGNDEMLILRASSPELLESVFAFLEHRGSIRDPYA